MAEPCQADFAMAERMAESLELPLSDRQILQVAIGLAAYRAGQPVRVTIAVGNGSLVLRL